MPQIQLSFVIVTECHAYGRHIIVHINKPSIISILALPNISDMLFITEQCFFQLTLKVQLFCFRYQKCIVTVFAEFATASSSVRVTVHC